MKTVLVLGATGNLGAYVAVYLKDKGYNVIAASRRKDDHGFFAEHGIKYYSFDVTDIESYKNLPQSGIDVVAHFAGELPSRYEFHPSDLIINITKGTMNVLEYMREIGCKRIIYPQTPYDIIGNYTPGGKPLDADGPRSFPHTGDHAVYAIAKNAACDLIEHYHYQYGFDRFILRFFTIYEYHPNAYHYANFKFRMMPFRMLMDRASKSLPIEIWGDASKAKEMVYVKDFIELVRLCVDANVEGGSYNVGNGFQVSLDDQIKGIVEVFSPKDNPSKITYCPEKPDPLENAFDISKTVRELGYSPKYSYLDQLRDFKHEMETEPFAKLWGTKEDYKRDDV
jgi:UDP-glucose 4-epimerase